MNAKKEAVARPLSVATASFRLQIYVSGQGLDGGVKRADGIDGAGLVGFVRAFDESAEDVARAAFDKQFAFRHELAQAGFPTDGAADLLAEVFADGCRRFHKVTNEILRDGAGRLGEGAGRQSFCKRFCRRCHDARMIGARHLQRHDTELLFREFRDGVRHFGAFAGNDDLPRTVVVCDVDAASRADFGDFVRIAAEHSGHAALRVTAGLVHEFAAFCNETQRVVRRQDICRHQGGVFAEGEAGGRGGEEVADAFLQGGHGRLRHREDGGLAVRAGRQIFDGAVEAEPRDVAMEDVVGAVENGLRRRRGVIEVFAHAGGLRPLAGEHGGYGFHNGEC